MLDCQLYGLNPAGHHLTSLFFHVANSLLLFLVFREATGRLWESAAIAALFGLHPFHVESVAWVSERKDVLSAFFFMLTLFAYIRYTRRPGHGRYWTTMVLFAIGLMAKPMLVTLPFVLLLLDFWPLGRLELAGPRQVKRIAKSLKGLVWEKIPLFLLSAASSVVTFAAQSKSGAVMTFEVISLKVRVLNAFLSYARYLEKMFFPHDLAIFYPHPGNSLALWQGVAAGLFLAFVSLLMIRQYAQRPFLLMGWLWFLGCLVPVIGIVQVGGQSMADRYTYLPSIGIFIITVWAVSGLITKVPHGRIWVGFAGSTIFVCLSIMTWSQIGHWRNSITLFRHALSVTSRNHVAHCNLGTAFLRKDRLDEAFVQLKKALDIWPSYPDALNNLGIVFARQGLLDKAIGYYEEALNANPKYDLAHLNMADALVELGHLNEAIRSYDKALSTKPDAGSVYNTIGVLLARLNKLDEAVVHLYRAIDLCPECPEPYNNLGRVLTLKGDLEGAVERLKRAIELRHDYAEAYNNLGLVYMQLGALGEAMVYFSSALHHKPDYTKARDNLRQIILLMPESLGPAAPGSEKGIWRN